MRSIDPPAGPESRATEEAAAAHQLPHVRGHSRPSSVSAWLRRARRRSRDDTERPL